MHDIEYPSKTPLGADPTTVPEKKQTRKYPLTTWGAHKKMIKFLSTRTAEAQAYVCAKESC